MSNSINSVGKNFSASPSSFPREMHREMHQGKDARNAPVSVDRQVPIIDKSKVDPELLKSAEGMESMFLDYMMKVMRESVPKNDMDLENSATDIYRGMLDSENVQKIANQGGIGLTDQILAYYESRGYDLHQGHEVPSKEKP